MNADVVGSKRRSRDEAQRRRRRERRARQAYQAKRVFAGTLGSTAAPTASRFCRSCPSWRWRLRLPRANGFEPRVAIDATVCAGKTPLRVIAAHADFLPWAAEAQAKAIRPYIGDDKDVLVLGDFNAHPHRQRHAGVWPSRAATRSPSTTKAPRFPGPKSRIDFILTGRTVKNPSESSPTPAITTRHRHPRRLRFPSAAPRSSRQPPRPTADATAPAPATAAH